MSKATKSRSDSDAQLVTFTGTPGGGAVKVDLHIVPTVIPTLTVEPGQLNRVVKKKKRVALTPAERRSRKIRLWMLQQHKRPNLETYRREMDDGHIAPPPACLRAGKRTFAASDEIPALRRAISAEFSRLWETRSPK